MKKKRWLSILLSFALLFSLPPVPVLATDGVLTKDDSGYYEIYDAADLQAYADLVNNGETNANGRLMNDISLSGVCGDGIGSWTPIGNSETHQFAGIFDGQGYTIMDLYIDTTSNAQGLFRIVGYGGTVKNVTVAGTVTGSASIGGVVGFVFPGGTVENCTNTGKVTCTDDVSGVVGGVVGNNFGGTVTNCSNTGEVKGTRWGGGVVGQNNYSGTVTNCYNTGTVTVAAIGTVQPGELGNVTAGGVVGGNWASVANCYSIGRVAGEYYGGVVGGNGDGGSVQNCYFLEDLEDETLSGIGITTGGTAEGVESKDTNAFASGEVAWLLNNRSEDGIWHQNLAGCLPANSPAVDAYPVPDTTHLQVKEAASGYTNTLVTDDAGVYLIYSGPQLYVFAQLVNGGEKDTNSRLMNDITLSDVCGDGIGSWPLIGKSGDYPFTGTFDGQGHTIMDLYINSSASYVGLFGSVKSGGTVKNVIVAGAVTGTGESYLGPYIGGVVGDNDGTVTNCINTVTVTGTGKYSYVSGVVGQNNGTVENCTNTGIVTGAGNYEGVGGVVGWNDRGGTVKNCTITGAVTGTGSGVYVGGVVSLNYGTVENCYFLQGTADSGVKRNLGTVRNVESKDADTFAGGEVAWLLQEKQQTQEPLIWGQKLGEDPTPVLTAFLPEGDAAGYAVYRVEFVMGDAAEGTSPVDTCCVNSGGTVSLPEAPEGYSGWYVDANTRFTSETEVTENLSVFAKKMEDMPNVSIDYANEELTGFADDVKYTINGSEVTPVNGTLSVAEYLGTTISVVRTAHEDSFADSAPQSLEIPSRRVMSAVGSEGETIIGYQDGKITELTGGETYQLSIDGGTSWETKTADASGSITGLAPGTYQIRLPATTTDFAGSPAEVTIAEGGPAYTVTIPASVTIDGTATISANNVNVAEGYSLNVKLTATSGTGNAFTLALKDHEDVTLGYTMTLNETTVKLGTDEGAQESTTTRNSAITVSVNPTVLSIPGGTVNSSGSSTLTFAMTSGQLKQYSGSYTGTVTFSVSVTQDEASDDSDNPGGSDTTTDTTGGDSGNTGDTTGENP